MPPVVSLRTIKPIIWVPPRHTASYKLELERSDGTLDDITPLVSRFEIEDGVTDVMGRFEFEIWDPAE